MEVQLFLFLFVFTLFLFVIGFFGVFIRQPADRAMFCVISGILFLILMIQSLNLEYIVYDPNIPDFVSYKYAQNGFEYLFPMGINFIMGSISLVNTFILLAPIWNRNIKNSDMPKGFENFNGI